MIKITNQANLKFQMMADALQVGILKCRTDKYFSIEEMNDGFVQLLGYTAADMENCFKNRLSECIYAEDRTVFQSLQAGIAQGKIYATAEFRIPEKSGAARWYRFLVLTQFDDAGTPSSAIGIIFNIDDEMQAIDRLRIQAEQDSLTGLYNRKETEKRIRQFLAGKPELNCALFMVDMDNFKQINDTKGHMVGDVVLTEAAAAMKSLMRSTDIVGRIGGDEFTVFMKNIPSKKAAEKKAERLADIFRHLFENEKYSVRLSCSIGVAVYPEDGHDFKSLYNHADQALYLAKTSGKNNYVMYDGNQIYHQEKTGVSSIGARIDSESRTARGLGDFLTDIFKILYRMENPDQAINLILEIVGKRFDVSRAYIFESTEDGKYTSNTYEWCNGGISPQIDLLQNLNYSQFGDYHTLFEDNSLFYCRDIAALHPAQRDLLEEQGICSTLQCAFWKGEELAGFIGFDECTGLRLWTEEEVDILSLIAQMMTIFLQKRRAMDLYSEMELQLHTILDSNESCIYVIGQDSFELLYLSQKTKDLMPKVQLGEFCYKAFFGKDNICEFCPLLNGGTGCLTLPGCGLQADLHASSMKWLGNDAYLLSFHADSGAMTVPGEINPSMMTEKSLADCLQWLASADYQDDVIGYVLRIVQNYYQSDRVYIIEVDVKHDTANNTYEICAPGVPPQKELLQNLPLETISFWMEQFAVRGYIKIDDIEELGKDRRLEYDILKKQGISSLMAIPLSGQGEVCNFLGVDDPRQNKKNFHYLRGLSYFLENELAKNSLKKSMELMVYQDAMTGLENRNSFMNYCDDFSKRMPAPTGVIYMDINGLKRLNDTKGHLYGDMLITQVSGQMKKNFPNARKFRLSGDEFLIVSEGLGYETFMEQINRLEESLSENGICIIAIGTTWNDIYTDLNESLHKADRLMYLRKQEYYKKSGTSATEKMPLLQDLTSAILNKEYLIYLQPKINLKSGRIDSAEALVRYRETDGSILPPCHFIPLLESEGLISNIDFFVLEEVCRLLTGWKDTPFADIRLALNFSRITLFDHRFLEKFLDVFKRYDLRPEQLEIEITETQETLNKKQMALLLEQLKGHGFGIVLDDFGVEYSSYEFLMMADFDLLKIDKSIVQRYKTAEKCEILVKHIVELCHELGIRCCAEGVETEEQYRFIKDTGCDYIQGFLIGKPVPPEQFFLK
ncbi:EAL domain-containing protein [uncultured Clostridium sp.]|uniref:bifunctional diguanylate cyclase/phosphodiesterase n=1 Tax=uncultured Clostridium sp. TaxID=59620 RepID=UPI0025F23D24|nr:EAL domain-containing protein [uncultured Clostridium sp.]